MAWFAGGRREKCSDQTGVTKNGFCQQQTEQSGDNYTGDQGSYAGADKLIGNRWVRRRDEPGVPPENDRL